MALKSESQNAYDDPVPGLTGYNTQFAYIHVALTDIPGLTTPLRLVIHTFSSLEQPFLTLILFSGLPFNVYRSRTPYTRSGDYTLRPASLAAARSEAT